MTSGGTRREIRIIYRQVRYQRPMHGKENKIQRRPLALSWSIHTEVRINASPLADNLITRHGEGGVEVVVVVASAVVVLLL